VPFFNNLLVLRFAIRGGPRCGDAPGFVPRHQVRRRSSAGLVIEVDVGERPAIVVADDEAGIVVDGPGWNAGAAYSM
jgi:hypothetical protein